MAVVGRAREPRPAPSGAEPQASRRGAAVELPGPASPPGRATGRADGGPGQTKGRPSCRESSGEASAATSARSCCRGRRATSSERASSTSSRRSRSDRAGNFAYVGRKRKKRDFRRLWIIRINAAARMHEMTYSQLMAGLKGAGIALDRKSLAEIAATDDAAFGKLVESAKAARPSA